MLFQILLWFFPWKIRRLLLNKFYGYEISKSARIGFSIITAKKIKMNDNSSIGHFTICKSIDRLEIGENSGIGNRNFITGFSISSPAVTEHGHFSHIPNRKCELIIGKHVGITSRHYFDCNGGIYIGDFCQIAGFETAFLTHSIDLKNNRQDAAPIHIGAYSFIGTRVTFIKGSAIPSYSIVGACTLVNKVFDREYSLYGGVPCKFIKETQECDFFKRENGFVI